MISAWRSDALLFLELINIASNFHYTIIDSINLLSIFLAISVARYEEYIIYRISFSKFSNVLPAFTCASAIGNLSDYNWIPNHNHFVCKRTFNYSRKPTK